MTNYRKGIRIEYKIKAEFEELGCYVMRSAGSHSCLDLLIISPTWIKGIQVKRLAKLPQTIFIENLFRDDLEKMRSYTFPDFLEIELWLWVKNKRFYKFKILKDEIKIIDGV